MKKLICSFIILFFVFNWVAHLNAEPGLEKVFGFTDIDTVQISDIQQDPFGFDSVTFQGVVTIGADLIDTSRFKAYIQDESSYGVLLFDHEFTSEMVSNAQRGNLLQVVGTVTEFSGITEITDLEIELIDSNQAIPAPETLTTSQINDLRWDGTLVYTEAEVTDVYSTGADFNVHIDDGSGETQIRVWSTTGIPMGTFQTGHWYAIKGVGSVYFDDEDTTYQMLVGYSEDINELDTTTTDTIPEDVTTIAQIQQDPSAYDEVTVEGVITIGANVIDTSYFKAYIQDASGYGVMLFNYDYQPGLVSVAKRGNLVRVTGTVQEYDEVTEIKDITVTLLDSNQALPPADTVATGALDDPRWDGTLVYAAGEVVDLYPTGNAFNAHLDDGSGNITVRVWGTTGITMNMFEMEHWYGILGVGSVFIDESETTYQILLGYEDDFFEIDTLSPLPPASANVKLQVPANTFAPSLGEKFPVTVNIPDEAEVVIRIYDIHGRLVKTLYDETTVGAIPLEWDGKDDYARMLNSGIYLCHMEVKEKVSGDIETKLAPITIGTSLK